VSTPPPRGVSSPADFPVQQEEDEVRGRAIAIAAAAALVVGGAGVAGAWLVLALGAPPQRPPVGPAPREIAHVEQTPIWVAKDGLDLRTQQRAELHAWGWVDRDAGVARIPIERAIDLEVERESR